MQLVNGVGTVTVLCTVCCDRAVPLTSMAVSAAGPWRFCILIEGGGELNWLGLGSFAVNTGGDPIEILTVINSGPPTQVQLGLELFSGTDPQRIKYVIFGAANIDEHDTNSGTIFGHPNAAGAEAVGAAFYADTPEFGQNPPELEDFSSAGPQPIFFDTLGNRWRRKSDSRWSIGGRVFSGCGLHRIANPDHSIDARWLLPVV